MTLLGLEIESAAAFLKKQNIPYEIQEYVSHKPYDDADSNRIVRVQIQNGIYKLTVCKFKTKQTSQG
ncbi:MAG: hypothetical protein RRY10_06175 [Christensenellaceae bacterium]